jgi:glycosyltransferase involved in cell wall biosynthesis
MNSSAIPRIKLLAVMEPKTVTGAAKNMLEFCYGVRELEAKLRDLPAVDTSIVTFERGPKSVMTSGQTRDSGDTIEVQSPNEFVTAARQSGVEVDVIPERTRFDLRVVSDLRRIVALRRPHLILTHHVKSHLVMRLSKLWQEYPWIAFHHGYTKTQSRERIYNRMDRLSLPKADRVVTVCEAFARELTRLAGVPRERIHVQHNSIRPEPMGSDEESQRLRRDFNIASDERLVVSIGRLSREKGHIDLLMAFKHLQEVHPEIKSKLLIVGDGPERGKLVATARSFRIADMVLFPGQIRNIQPYYGLADVVALPSHSEGSPYVLLEAMAAKVPIVATAVGGVPEMVDDEESALLVPPLDPRAMAAAIARILTHPELALKLTENASTLVTTRYAPETQIRSLIQLYRSVVTIRERAKASRR